VPACGVPVGFGCLPPEQAGQLPVQDGLVAFRGQDPVRALAGEVGDVVALAVQRVRGDDDTAEVADLFEQGGEAGDFGGLTVDIGTGQYNTGGLIGGCEDMPGSGGGRASVSRVTSCRPQRSPAGIPVR
jgi:hypothetical protein